MSTVRIEHDGAVTIVTIDRPDVRNAVDRATAEALADAFRAFEDDGDRDVAAFSRAMARLPRPRTLEIGESCRQRHRANRHSKHRHAHRQSWNH